MNSFKKVFIVCFFFAISMISFGQTTQCGDDEFAKLQRNTIPNYDELIKQNNQLIKNYIDENFDNQQKSASAANYLIPVVFHIVHPVGQTYGTGSNISYQQIVSQINALNAAFAKNYPAYNGQNHPSYAQNTDIKFCLASNAAPSSLTFFNGPNGIEKGVMRYADNTLTNHQISNPGATALLGLTHPTPAHFPFANYLNIWIVTSLSSSSSGVIMGYAPKPIQSSFPLDGVVMRSDVIGDNSVSNNNFSLNYGLTQGKILTHEVGHYLNLYHIFEGGCSGANASTASSDQCDLNGDNICDIEPCTTQNYNCNTSVPNTCNANYVAGTTTNDMIEDYMSYADDDCMNTFTQGQKLRMHATLNTLRSNLWNTGNLAQTGVVGPGGCSNSVLYANITKSTNNICLNTPLVLSNSFLGNTAITWTWTLAGSNPNTANTSSVSVTYTASGSFWAKLSVSDGSITIKDSTLLGVTSCSLDPTKLNRSNWLFGNQCSVSFASGVPVANNLASVNNTIKCFENAISMSDTAGNLLFYCNGEKLWNGSHVQVNTSPVFGYTFTGSYQVSSVYGIMAVPLPKSSTKYLLLCVPPFEIVQNYLNPPAPAGSEEVAYVIYDTQTQTLSPVQHLLFPGLPYRMAEDMTLVPHCNGVDYWMIVRGAVSYPALSLQCSFYSFLINQNGLAQNLVPVTSGTFSSVSYYEGLSGIKANKAGTRLACKVGGTGSAVYPGAALYDFNSTTGVISNEVLLPGFYLDTAAQTYKQIVKVNATIFSPNGQYLFVFDYSSQNNRIMQFNTANLNIAPKIFSNTTLYYAEVGPDNNIYFGNAYDANKSLSAIVNPDSWTGATFVLNACTLNVAANVNANSGLLNYMEVDKPAEVHPILVQQTSCSAFSFSLNPCWGVYTASWNFGDASPTVTAQTTTHTYAAPGIYTVSLTMNYQGQNIPIYTKTVQVINPAAISITGPNLLCIGSTFLNSYSVPNLFGATYSWTTSNANVVGLNTMPSINLAGANTGVATLTAQVNVGGCNVMATKTITVDSLPLAQFTNTLGALCMGDSILLTYTPPGGTLTGQCLNGNYFKASIYSNTPFIINYTRTSANGCTNVAALSITVAVCTGIHANIADLVHILPNPTNGELNVNASMGIDKLEVINCIGEIVLKKGNVNEKSVLIDLSNLPSNIYFIKVHTPNGSVVKKVIKD